MLSAKIWTVSAGSSIDYMNFALPLKYSMIKFDNVAGKMFKKNH
jgi:hypothetical protein